MHTKPGENLLQLELEKEGYKRLFVVGACVGENGYAFTECKTLKEAKAEKPYFVKKYGYAEIIVTVKP